MEHTQCSRTRLMGLSLPGKTTNENGQSSIDCGNLWQKFEAENYFEQIPGRQSDEIFAVYHHYDGDHTQPFDYFIGCKVDDQTPVPPGLDSITIPEGMYRKVLAAGKMPDCVADAWRKIWNSEIPRAYQTDFEVYSEKSTDWNKAEVEIYLSV